MLKCFFFNFKNCLSFLGVFLLLTEILFSYGFFLAFSLVLKDIFKITFSQDAIVSYFGFLNYPPIIFTSVSFSFHIWGYFFFHFFLFFGLPFCLIRGEGGGNFAISVETLNTFNIFLRAYNRLLRGVPTKLLVAFSFAVGVTRWKLATTEADRLPK